MSAFLAYLERFLFYNEQQRRREAGGGRESQRGPRQDLGKEKGEGVVRAGEGGSKSKRRKAEEAKSEKWGKKGKRSGVLRTHGNIVDP